MRPGLVPLLGVSIALIQSVPVTAANCREGLDYCGLSLVSKGVLVQIVTSGEQLSCLARMNFYLFDCRC